MVIEVSNLTFGYSENADVLRHVSFSIEKGKYVSVVGHNGSGKSTLAKILIGLLAPKEGTVTIEGTVLTPKTVSELRRKMALVFQNPDNQFIGSTVEDDIAFGLENRRVAHEKMQPIIDEYAGKVGMGDYLRKEPSMLSGGQKQRVAIAGALSLHPEILILDEATSMLDPRGKSEIRALIQDMKKENPDLTVLSVTHDIEEAYESDEVIVISKGEIALQGKPGEVLKEREVLAGLGLEMPFFLDLKERLAGAGIDVSSCRNMEELEEVLCRLK